MYTQCPECDVAFRVTAEVLKQAAGKVRCGGCGVAFNALLHLSEDMPDAVAAESPAPETPESTVDESGELEAGTRPESISAEQSAALLKTLDQLAGEDIRIEDTGIEWRVLDPSEDNDVEPFEDDSTPTVAHEEMRFDDNTPLPDDFDLDALSSPTPEPATEVVPETAPSIEDSQVDLAFGEPDGWEDLLDDLEEAAAAMAVEETPAEAAEEVPAEAAAAVAIEATDQSSEIEALPDIEEIEASVAADQPLDMDTQFAIQAEAMGIDLSGMHAKAEESEVEAEVEAESEAESEAEAEVEAEIEAERETSIDEDLIAAAFEAEAAAKVDASIAEDLAPEEMSRAGILDEDDYLEVITEDVAEEEPEPELEPEPEERIDKQLEQDLLALEAQAIEAEIEEPAEEEPDDVELEAELEAELEEQLEEDEVEAAAESLEEEELEEVAEDEELDEVAEDAELDEYELEEVTEDEDVAVAAPTEEEIEAELELAFQGFTAEEDDFDDALENFSEPDVVDVPEPTEEEKTLNMMIDQDLLAIAVEDDDGFTSTIVQKQISSNDDIPKEQDESDMSSFADTADALESPFQRSAAQSNPLVETIIMEGAFAHSEEDLQRRAADRRAASASLKKSDFEADKNRRSSWETPRYGKIAAAVLLFIVLIAQVIHHSREAFATSETFQKTIGPIYRMVGSPVTPAWDIRGWRFEATKGSTDDDDQVLTIYSRIGNTSEQALPFPLVHVSLTDRFEEIIGSRVLEPAEYLVGNADPRRPVPAGDNFNAVFTIESPSLDATGFKLNVCYRLTSGQLRCGIEDFK